MPGAINCPAESEASSFFFQSNSPFELTVRPVLLIGSGILRATYSLPRVRIILIRESSDRLLDVSAFRTIPDVRKKRVMRSDQSFREAMTPAYTETYFTQIIEPNRRMVSIFLSGQRRTRNRKERGMGVAKVRLLVEISQRWLWTESR